MGPSSRAVKQSVSRAATGLVTLRDTVPRTMLFGRVARLQASARPMLRGLASFQGYALPETWPGINRRVARPFFSVEPPTSGGRL
jgi:hypothetical protein